MNDSARREPALRLDAAIDCVVKQLTSAPNDPYFAARAVAALDGPARASQLRAWLVPSAAVVALVLLVVAGVNWRREGVAPTGVDAGPSATRRTDALAQPMSAAPMAAIEPAPPADPSTASRAPGRAVRTVAVAGATAGGAELMELEEDTSRAAGDESEALGAVAIGQLGALDPIDVDSLEFPTASLDTVRVEPVAIEPLEPDRGRPGTDGAR